MKTISEYRSTCHYSPVVSVTGGDDGMTSFWICDQCHEPCDAKTFPIKSEDVETAGSGGIVGCPEGYGKIPKDVENWERDFDKRFNSLYLKPVNDVWCSEKGNNVKPSEVKTFIRNLLDTRNKQLYQSLEEMKKSESECGCDAGRFCGCKVFHFNEAIIQAQELLGEKPPKGYVLNPVEDGVAKYIKKTVTKRKYVGGKERKKRGLGLWISPIQVTTQNTGYISFEIVLLVIFFEVHIQFI